jgi:uncharacterized membrane protein
VNKTEFINTLSKTLEEGKVIDIYEIVAEYEQHFLYKIADGFCEEEIASRLGDPEGLAKQFYSEPNTSTKGNKAIVAIGLGIVDLVISVLFVSLFVWVIVMVVATAAFCVLGVCLMFNLNIYSLLPSMPYFVSIIFGMVSLALAVLTAVGTIYFWLFSRQLLHSYFRWHRNTLAGAGGEAILPSIATHPQIAAVRNRHMRNIALIAVIVFVITSLSGYIVASISAGNLEFWHAWGWFGYP